jgi:hypothetical protein
MEQLGKVIGMFVGTWIVVILIGFLLAWFAMLLWNITIPDVFGLPEITYKQMFALYLLIKILFGSNVSFKNNN